LIALVSSSAFPQGHVDDHELAQMLPCDWVRWDDDTVDWSKYELAVVRSVWDYPLRRDAFLSWSRTPVRVVNPHPVLSWNTDKRYLAQVARAGLPVVPTTFIVPGHALSPPKGDFVVKPSVSMGGLDAARFGPEEHDRASQHLAAIHRTGRTALMQPYMASVDRDGETNIVYIAGKYSHAVRKEPMLVQGADALSNIAGSFAVSATEPSVSERTIADRTIRWLSELFGTLLYARVDLMTGPSGTPLITELELTDPLLSFRFAPGAAERFASELIAQLQGARIPARA
jgi:glutathione synthase/RimK-type ligase-like ATP-grasp enzyme